MLKVTSIQLAGQYKKSQKKVTSDQSASEDKSLANWVEWQKADILHFNQITISGPKASQENSNPIFRWFLCGLILKSKGVEQEGKGGGKS